MRIDLDADPCLANASKYAMMRMVGRVEATKIQKRGVPVRMVVVIVRVHAFLSTSIAVDQIRLYDERAGREQSQQVQHAMMRTA